ncbi:MAG TPA: anti-sigma factor [Planktothrix sp.]|jgi:predicted anti-sigma-YlaC factor YlaD
MDTACTRYRTDLSAMLDGQLEGQDHSDVRGHLEGCSSCSEELETLKKLTKFLNESMQPENVEMPELWAGIQTQMPSVCDVMQEDLSAYLDGELTPAAQEGVNQHLKDCAQCLESFTLMNAANRLLSKGLELSPSVKVDLWPAVKAQLNEDCALIRSEISGYIDQEVATLRHRGITNHLLECTDCQGTFNELSNVGEIVRDSYKPDIPEDFDLWPGIKAKMQVVPFAAREAQSATTTDAKAGPARRRLIFGAVAAAVIGLSGVVMTLTMTPQQSPTAMSSEAYLIESALAEPSDQAEAVAYEQE